MINPLLDPVLARSPPSAERGTAAGKEFSPINAGMKTRLTFTPYVLTSGSMQVDHERSFAVMLNPAELSHSRSITYDDQKTFGGPGSTLRFSAMGNDTIKFAIVLDGTGVVPTTGEGPTEVKQQVKQLEGAIYRYDGKDRQPPYVRIVWRSTAMTARIASRPMCASSGVH